MRKNCRHSTSNAQHLDVRAPRSKLFVANDRWDRLDEAVAVGADALSFDLEDAVAEVDKDAARQQLVRSLRGLRTTSQVWVRVNAAGSPHVVADILALTGLQVRVVNLPKADSPSDIQFVERLLAHVERAGGSGPIAIVPTVESAPGLRNAVAIATASPRVLALQLGAGDLRRSTGITDPAAGLTTLRTLLSLAAAEAGVPVLDSTGSDIVDAAAFEADARAARSLGYQGKSCMHAAHVAVANRVFDAGHAR